MEMKSVRATVVKEVSCPWCGQQAGQPCVTLNYRKSPSSTVRPTPHAVRVAEWKVMNGYLERRG